MSTRLIVSAVLFLSLLVVAYQLNVWAERVGP